MAFVARGRGIGRGRGFGIPKAQTRPGEDSDGQKNTSSESAHATEEFDLSKHLCDLRESNLDDKGEQLSKYISSSDSSTKIKQVVDLLCQRTMTDSDFAPLAAKVASKLCCEESCGSAFRSCLLKNTQENYKNRASIREKSLGKWFGLVGLICEFFNHLRTGEAPLKPLAGAAFQTMSELLREEDAANERQDVEEDEIDCFYQHFKTVGQLLESVDQVSQYLKGLNTEKPTSGDSVPTPPTQTA